MAMDKMLMICVLRSWHGCWANNGRVPFLPGSRSDLCLPDAAKIDSLKAGKLPIYERGLDELLSRVDIRFTTDPAEAVSIAEVIFIAVGTPPQPDGSPDLRYLRAAANSIAEHPGSLR